MSRYELPAENIHDPNVTAIVVGWDRPLKTFFIQVHVPHPTYEGETRTVLHEGCDLDKPVTMDEIKTMISPYGSVPPEIEEAMKSDQSNSISQVDGPEQARMKDLIRRLFDYED